MRCQHRKRSVLSNPGGPAAGLWSFSCQGRLRIERPMTRGLDGTLQMRVSISMMYFCLEHPAESNTLCHVRLGKARPSPHPTGPLCQIFVTFASRLKY